MLCSISDGLRQAWQNWTVIPAWVDSGQMRLGALTCDWAFREEAAFSPLGSGDGRSKKAAIAGVPYARATRPGLRRSYGLWAATLSGWWNGGAESRRAVRA